MHRVLSIKIHFYVYIAGGCVLFFYLCHVRKACVSVIFNIGLVGRKLDNKTCTVLYVEQLCLCGHILIQVGPLPCSGGEGKVYFTKC
jgi:hypothetical protein